MDINKGREEKNLFIKIEWACLGKIELIFFMYPFLFI